MKDIGLLLVQSARRVAHDPLISSLGHGLEEILVKSDMRLVTRVVRDAKAEADVYRSWQASNAVDGVILVRLEKNDSRTELLRKLGMPFAAVVDQEQVGDFSAVVFDDAATMRSAVDHLASRGHRDIVYLVGADSSSARTNAFVKATGDSDIRGRVVSDYVTFVGDARATEHILALDPRPTAVIYDDDNTAVAGLEAIKAAGLEVPSDMAVVSWNDSVICQAASPAITAVRNVAHTVGQLAGQCLIEMSATGKRALLRAPATFIVERSST